jgi:lipopolysaccharide export system protein LptA
MKRFGPVLLAGAATLALAQTHLSPAAAPAPRATTITSDHAEFDLNLHRAVYQGHVHVDYPEMILTSAWLTVDLPESGGHLNHVVAETNVAIDFVDEKGGKYHVTAAKAVYDYKVVGTVANETVTFTGQPVVTTATSRIESEPMIWDRIKNKFSFFNPIMKSTGVAGETNANGSLPKLF